ncbi:MULTISPECIES: PhzF family phenazine biosynthesis protein [unclassified Streptomyces]|uniref:PhzF family phenazine biosynthesis protein n=1 Tax=unclassified Streptomyces TaxID=2593676 RepID=UPI00037833DA|nr:MULTISPECIES: PhzF family phenazine biosynthesis protein [unclassified Streptomyces]MYT30731.1 PhzF family phenazine biosynthesis protein [Streptomyces sp. SID8354]
MTEPNEVHEVHDDDRPGVELLRVFCGPDGDGGNPLAVVLDGAALPDPADRAALAAELGYSETVFLDPAAPGDDPDPAAVDIHTPSVRLPFAGHPLVGLAWLLRSLGRPVRSLRPPAGVVGVRHDGDLAWVRARADWVTARRTERYDSAAEVDALPAPPPGEGWLYAWAWQDEAAGTVRARGFPRRGDTVVEDEATGAAALLLTHQLGRALDIRQGAGSQLLTRPCADGTIEIGGRVRAGVPDAP